MKVDTSPHSGETVAKRMFWLAWQATGGPVGLGWLQHKANATEDDVWQNVCNAEDYPYKVTNDRPGMAHGDYVFGRMLKLIVKYDDSSVEVRDQTPRADYQAWCRTYSTYETLAQAAIQSLNG
jgi:hypothetical protein